jgi:hypothetical protein
MVVDPLVVFWACGEAVPRGGNMRLREPAV